MAASASDKARKSYSYLQKTLNSGISASDVVLTPNNVTNIPTDTGVSFVVDRVDSSGNKTPTVRELMTGYLSGSTIAGLVRGEQGTTAQVHSGGAVIEFVNSGKMWNDLIDFLLQDHSNPNGNHKTLTDDNGNEWLERGSVASAVNQVKISNAATGNDPSVEANGDDTNISLNLKTKGTGRIKQNGSSLLPVGMIIETAAPVVPTGWLMCDGSAVSRTTYADLFAALIPSIGTFTITIATPGVATLSSHGLQTGDAVYLTTTGALPTGLTANTLYYAIRIDANTFNLATSRANAYAGTKIATSGTQSGTHTLRSCPHGLGDGSTTFNVPDTRGRVLAGNDYMGGTAAARLALAASQSTYGNLGASGGEERHLLTVAELAAHTHNAGDGSGFVVGGAGGAAASITQTGSAFRIFANSNSTGSDTPHNNVQPTLVVNHLIKT